MRRPEQQVHKTIVAGLRLALPHGWIVQHTPNKPRSKVSGAIEKSMGAVAGWPDITILGVSPLNTVADVEIAIPTAWFIEVKAKRGRTSDAQDAVHDKLRDLGFPVAVVKSWDEALAAARKWGLPLKVRLEVV